MTPDVTAPWSGLTPPQVRQLLEGVTTPWWICGGWAIELFAPTAQRAHADMDIGCFRPDAPTFMGALPEIEFFAAQDGALTPHPPSRTIGDSLNSFWCRLAGSSSWDFQLMLEPVEDEEWRCRRDPMIRRAPESIVLRMDDGLRVLRPEIQLLYKAKDVRERDQLDFDAVVPLLDLPARSWLVDGIRRLHVGHPWISSLVGR